MLQARMNTNPYMKSNKCMHIYLNNTSQILLLRKLPIFFIGESTYKSCLQLGIITYKTKVYLQLKRGG
jgi:hypothetical protein